jgi:hypothetical protein
MILWGQQWPLQNGEEIDIVITQFWVIPQNLFIFKIKIKNKK